MSNLVVQKPTPIYEPLIDPSKSTEFVIDQSSGQVHASLSATARMLKVSEATVRRAVTNAGDEITVINATIPTPSGNRPVRLLSSLEVFHLAYSYNRPLAEAMGKVGANLYLLKEAGYEPNPESQPRKPTMLEMAKAYLESEKQLEELREQVEEDLPATILGKLIDVSSEEGLISVGDFAKALSTSQHPLGRRRLFIILRELGIIQKSEGSNTLPYQFIVEKGYMVVTESTSPTNKAYALAFITPKGQTYLAKRYQEFLDSGLDWRMVAA
jgi:phage antirepressor YoqD-like protein